MADLTSSAPQANSDRWHAVGAGFLGWTLDAFDFFVVIFMLDTLAAHFHVPKADIVLSVTAHAGHAARRRAALRHDGRPLWPPPSADGQRHLLLRYRAACGFAPNFTVFFILRMLFGIGMGGEWGVGASLAMEHAPYGGAACSPAFCRAATAIGYLLAALAARLVLPSWLGWRAMFWVGGIPALLALYIRTKVPESEAWQAAPRGSAPSMARASPGSTNGWRCT